MRKKFVGHFIETEESIDQIWKNGIFVYDANVLLNLYRYSKETRKEFIKLLDSLKNRSWLPNQAVHEFLKNRTSVIGDQIKLYRTTKTSIDNLCKSFSISRSHPFISDGSNEILEKAINSINIDLKKNEQALDELITKDIIREKVADIFENRVGECYTEDKLDKLFKDGEERYISKTPPGYKDSDKKDNGTLLSKLSRYGDWILWRQVLDYSSQNKCPIILVTGDEKEDWWLEAMGRTISPRPELISEFASETSQKILIYKPDSFINTYSSKELGAKISNESLKEIESEYSSRINALTSKEYKNIDSNNEYLLTLKNNHNAHKIIKRNEEFSNNLSLLREALLDSFPLAEDSAINSDLLLEEKIFHLKKRRKNLIEKLNFFKRKYERAIYSNENEEGLSNLEKMISVTEEQLNENNSEFQHLIKIYKNQIDLEN